MQNLKLNLGCGKTPREGWVNLDMHPWPGVDVVRDVLTGLPFSDGVIAESYSENFLEHIPQDKVIWMMNELWRVTSPNNGFAVHIVPEFGSIADIGDPTHLSRWTPAVFTYFEWGHGHNRYYGDLIKPWVITIEKFGPNGCLKVRMVKYVK